jgi:Mg-chelatase subunit ChlD
MKMTKKVNKKIKKAAKKIVKKVAKVNDIEAVIIVDRSGSMQPIADDTVGAFNEFLQEQRKAKGKTTITHIQFDTEYEVLADGVEVSKAKEYTTETYQPRGCTALYDAVGKAMTTVMARIEAMPEKSRPKVLVAILTDGQENSSREYNKDTVKALIEKSEKVGWSVVYLGVGFDQMTATAASSLMGINAMHTMTVDHTSKGMGYGGQSLCMMSNSVRSLGDVGDVSTLTKHDGTDDEC